LGQPLFGNNVSKWRKEALQKKTLYSLPNSNLDWNLWTNAYFDSLGKSHILGPQLHYWSLLLWVFFPHICVDIGTDNLLCLKATHEAASVGLHVAHCLQSTYKMHEEVRGKKICPLWSHAWRRAHCNITCLYILTYKMHDNVRVKNKSSIVAFIF
jgi:hypothetical protein